MKGVFAISGASRYDDLIAERYHFPLAYLNAAKAWIVYRETRAAGGRMAYIATGQVRAINPDPEQSGLFYARIIDSLEFDRPVPYRDHNGRFEERMLRELDDPAVAGRTLQGRSSRRAPSGEGLMANWIILPSESSFTIAAAPVVLQSNRIYRTDDKLRLSTTERSEQTGDYRPTFGRGGFKS